MRSRSTGRVQHSRTPDQGGRYTHDRPENERAHGRSGRKDGSRGEAMKSSSNFGISKDNYDMIEIQMKPLVSDRTGQGSHFNRRCELTQQSDVRLVPNDEEWRNLPEEWWSASSGEDPKERFHDDDNQSLWRDESESQGGRGRGHKFVTPVQAESSGSNLQSPYGNQETGSLTKVLFKE